MAKQALEQSASLWTKTKRFVGGGLIILGGIWVAHELWEAHQSTHEATTNALPETLGNAPEIMNIQDSVYNSASQAGIMEAANDDSYALAA